MMATQSQERGVSRPSAHNVDWYVWQKADPIGTVTKIRARHWVDAREEAGRMWGITDSACDGERVPDGGDRSLEAQLRRMRLAAGSTTSIQEKP
jgi:hypothetical protein